MCPPAKAFTLAETLVSGLLLSICSLVACQMLGFTLLSQSRYSHQQEMLLQGQKALRDITQQLRMSRSDRIQELPGGQGLVFPLARMDPTEEAEYDARGVILWRAWQALRWDPKTERLSQSLMPLEEPATSLETFEVGDLAHRKVSQVRALLTNVGRFQAEPVGDHSWSLHLTFAAGGQRPCVYEIQTRVVPVN